MHENIGYGIFVQGLNGVSNSFFDFILVLLLIDLFLIICIIIHIIFISIVMNFKNICSNRYVDLNLII